MDDRAHRSNGAAILEFMLRSTMMIVLTLLASPALAQTLVAVDDEYGVSFADPLVVEEPGVMSNDTYGGSPMVPECRTRWSYRGHWSMEGRLLGQESVERGT